MYIAPGKGQTAPGGQSFDVNRNVLSLHSFVEKKMPLKSDFTLRKLLRLQSVISINGYHINVS